jgi:hypothetical protein
MRYWWLLFIFGCGKAPIQIDPAFNKYVASFEATYNVKVQVNITFKAQPEPRVGVCYTQNGVGKLINIDPVYWSQIDEEGKELLMYHEFGHCVLGRSHRSDYMNMDGDYVPASIMNPYMFSSYMYSKHRKHYENELAQHE